MIRRMEREDLEQVKEIYGKAFAGNPWYEDLTREEIGRRCQSIGPNYEDVVWVDGNPDSPRVVGALWSNVLYVNDLRHKRAGNDLAEFAVKHIHDTHPVWSANPEFWTLHWETAVIVDPEFAGKHIATFLRMEFLDKLRTTRRKLILTRMRDDNLAIIKIAENLEFARTGIKVPSSQKPNINHEYWYKEVCPW